MNTKLFKCFKYLTVICFLIISLPIHLYAVEFATVNSNAGLILRTEPDSKSKQILLIPFNEKVIISGNTQKIEVIKNIKAEWLKVQYKEKSGFVFSGFLTFINEIDPNGFIGKYSTKDFCDTCDQRYPTEIFLEKNNKFKMYINLCDNFGTLYGVWKIVYSDVYNDNILQIQLTGSDFGLKFKNKVILIYRIMDKRIVYIESIPAWSIGCDLMKVDIFFKE